MRTVMLALACVLVATPPAMAKKKHARPHALKLKKGKRGKALARSPKPAPTRVAAVERHAAPSEPTPPAPSPSSAPAPSVAPSPAPSPPVEHGPMGPQASDDEVPGSRMKR